MAAPYEVIAAPYTVWVAPTSTAKPNVNVTPSGSWTKLGTSGTKSYDKKGVIVTHGQTIVGWKPAGSTGARKVWRTEEFVTVELDLVDLTAEMYAKVLNDSTLTTTTSPPVKSFNLQQGAVINELALLCRGISPLGESLNAQYFIPIVYQAADPAPAYAGEGQPAMLTCKFQSLEDSSLGFGSWEEGTA